MNALKMGFQFTLGLIGAVAVSFVGIVGAFRFVIYLIGHPHSPLGTLACVLAGMGSLWATGLWKLARRPKDTIPSNITELDKAVSDY